MCHLPFPAASAASAASLSIPAAPRAEKPHHAVKGVLVFLENPTAHKMVGQFLRKLPNCTFV